MLMSCEKGGDSVNKFSEIYFLWIILIFLSPYSHHILV